jgi:hypothetical protein
MFLLTKEVEAYSVSMDNNIQNIFKIIICNAYVNILYYFFLTR